MKRLLIIGLLLCGAVKAEDLFTHACVTVGSPSTCTQIPNKTFIDVTPTLSFTTMTDPSQNQQWYVTAYDKAFYVEQIDAMCHLGSWREPSSEPNRSFTCHKIGEHRLELWSVLGSWHNSEFNEGGHPVGDVNIDPTSGVTIGQYGATGAQASENPRLGLSRFDFVGQASRNRYPGISTISNVMASLQVGNQLGSAAFDPVNGDLCGVGGGTGTQPTWCLDRDTNVLNVAATQTGSPPSPAGLNQAFTYNTVDGKIYTFGGDVSGVLNAFLYRYSVTTGVWERLDLTQTCNVSEVTGVPACPGARARAGFTHDSNRNIFLLHGGCTTTGTAACPSFNDIWKYDPVANAWTELLTSCTPSGSCVSGRTPFILNGVTTNERWQYVRELDLYWVMYNNVTTGSAEVPHYWIFRMAPGGPIGTQQKYYTYTKDTSAAQGLATGTLNRGTVDATQQGWAFPGGLAVNPATATIASIWTETAVSNTSTSSVSAKLHPFVKSWKATTGPVNVPSASTAYSLLNADVGAGNLEAFDASIGFVANQPWGCYDYQGVSVAGTATCKGYDGAGWNLGGDLPEFGTNKAAFPVIVSVDNLPTAAWREREQSNQIQPQSSINPTWGRIAQYTGGAWVPMGVPVNPRSVINTINQGGGISAGDTSMVVTTSSVTAGFQTATNFVPFPILIDTEQIMVTAVNGAGTTWTMTRARNGTAAASHANGATILALTWNVDSLALATDGTSGNLYAATTVYTTVAQTSSVTQSAPNVFLYKWNSGASTWDVQCGGSGNRLGAGSKAFDVDVTLLGGIPYLAWLERTGNSNTPQLVVAKCSGGTWSTVYADLRKSGTITESGGGSAAFGFAYRPRITNDTVDLGVAWAEQNNGQQWLSSSANQTSFGQKSHVFAAKVTTAGAVTYLGGALNVDPANGSANHPDIVALSTGNWIVQWAEVNAGSFKQMYIRQWNGLDWGGLSPPIFGIITGSPLPNGTNGMAYSTTIQTANAAPGNLISCTVTAGALPGWASLSVSGQNCLVSGTAATGSSSFTVTATDSASNTANQSYSLTVVSGFIITTTSPLPGGVVGTSYSTPVATAQGTGNVTACSITAGTLPAWASLLPSGTTCILSGTPNLVGVSSFTIQATDSAANTASQPFQLTVTSNCNITTTSLPNGTQGSSYSQTLASTSCVAPVVWSVVSGSLPTGLSLNPSSGAITGTPSAAAPYTFTVQIFDSASAQDQQLLTITIDPPACTAPTITSTSPITGGTVNQPYTYTFTATGTAPLTWGATGVPSWALFSTAGVLSGTPDTATAYSIPVTVTNACGSAGPTSFSLTIGANHGGTTIKGTVTTGVTNQ